MGMERYGKKEVKSTGSVNEMDIVSEGEGEEDDKQNFCLPTCWVVLCNRKYQKRTQCGGLGCILLFQISFESTIVIKFSECDDFFWLAEYLRILSPSLNPYSSICIIIIIIYIGNYFSRVYRLVSSSSLEQKWVIFLYKSWW